MEPTGPRFSFEPSQRYPDPRVEVLDERFLKYRLFSGTVEQLATGLRWAEGPQWFGDGRYLLVSDIPNNRILRWDEASGAVSEFRSPSNNANGLARDRQGRCSRASTSRVASRAPSTTAASPCWRTASMASA
jgi:gluconolactonase